MAPTLLRPSATQVVWEIIKGETFDLHVPVLDATGAPVAVGGWTAKSQVRRSDVEGVLHEWSTAQANITVSGTEVVLAVVGAVTATWAFTDAQVSVVVTDLGGKPHTVAVGTIHALPQITQ